MVAKVISVFEEVAATAPTSSVAEASCRRAPLFATRRSAAIRASSRCGGECGRFDGLRAEALETTRTTAKASLVEVGRGAERWAPRLIGRPMPTAEE